MNPPTTPTIRAAARPATSSSGPTRVAPAPTRPEVAPDEQVETRELPTTDDGDHDRFTHYVGKKALERARRKGTAVTALCGKRWKPDGDPSRFPMCPTCADIAAEMLTRGLDG